VTDSRSSLFLRALSLFAVGALGLALLLFGTAGTIAYWEAWLYLAVLFIPIFVVLVYLTLRDPDLLRRRLQSREARPAQRRIIGGAAYIILLALVIPGFDHRFGWSDLPPAVVLAADGIVLLGYLLFIRVLRENSYAARTITVEAGQQVITTGPYRRIRHPMYSAILLIYLATPLALGSIWGVLPALLLPWILAQRATDEERLLAEELPGYRDYLAITKYRFVPGIW
jgi:protein-S-isoprenylcysteine O-methyltransferase Ste14